MPVDLLWYGGIGTYVKGGHETQADAHDRANDAVRIDASDLSTRVVAEGGNLGLTQEARVEAALDGVALNSDAIDNSGGVDLSDHEVNYKILLAPLARGGVLDDERRDELLFDVVDDACARVLAHNRGQALCLSLDERRSRADPEQFSWAVEYLCRAEGMDPAEGRIPDPATLVSRDRGLLRPELTWLLGLAKLHLSRELTASERPLDLTTEPLYEDYFPSSLATAEGVDIATHPLRREISAMAATNHLIDLGGITLIPSLVRELDVDVATAASLILIARMMIDRFDYRSELTTTPGIDREAGYDAIIEFEHAVRNVARLLARRDWDAITADDVFRWSEGLDRLRSERDQFPAESQMARGEVAATELRNEGFSQEAAQDAAAAPLVDLGLSIIWVSERTGAPVVDAAITYAVLGDRARLNWVYDRMARIRPENSWDRLEMVDLRSEMLDLHGSLTEDALRCGGEDIEVCVDALLADKASLLDRIQDLQHRAATSDHPSAVAAVVKALKRLRT
jgi:glutamate dehydrogenase